MYNDLVVKGWEVVYIDTKYKECKCFYPVRELPIDLKKIGINAHSIKSKSRSTRIISLSIEELNQIIKREVKQ